MFSCYYVRSTRPSKEYRTLLIYVESRAKLEAVDTPPEKEPACLEAGYSASALKIT